VLLVPFVDTGTADVSARVTIDSNYNYRYIH
jgi:hypothetical protein